MKIVSSNISPLPFYDNIKLQNHRKDYAYGHVFPLITYANFLLPFQFNITDIHSISDVDIPEVLLFDFNTGTSEELNLQDYGLEVKNMYNDGCLLIKYPAILPLPEIKYEGLYYLCISIYDGQETIPFYSDVFTITFKIDRFLKLEYRNEYNFKLAKGIVDFSDNFKFRCYLDTQVGKPEYSFEEEATERMGYSFIESQVSKKIYKFSFIAPEYLCDALRLVRLCENKKIVSRLNEYYLTTFIMEPKWEEQGDLAAVECEFETDTVIANVGGYQPVLLGGDFNNDFNNDFNVE